MLGKKRRISKIQLNKHNEYEALAKERPAQLSKEWFQRYDRIKMVYQNFSKLSDWLIDMNKLNQTILSKDNFEEIKRAIGKDAVIVKKIIENITIGFCNMLLIYFEDQKTSSKPLTTIARRWVNMQE